MNRLKTQTVTRIESIFAVHANGSVMVRSYSPAVPQSDSVEMIITRLRGLGYVSVAVTEAA